LGVLQRHVWQRPSTPNCRVSSSAYRGRIRGYKVLKRSKLSIYDVTYIYLNILGPTRYAFMSFMYILNLIKFAKNLKTPSFRLDNSISFRIVLFFQDCKEDEKPSETETCNQPACHPKKLNDDYERQSYKRNIVFKRLNSS